MPTYKIRGIEVDFPYEAYDCQLVYMEKVIQSLQNRCNALLESPTGTGKTLCLLCATLAWRKSLGDFSRGRCEGGNEGSSQPPGESLKGSESSRLPKIIYASRTHSQLRQVIQELKRTNYRPKMVILGSREQLCIHEEVRLLHGKIQTNTCHSLCKKRPTKRYCAHFSRVAEFLRHNPGLGDEPIDIEDLVNVGRSSGPCPYYLSRELHKAVDILFAPYNYLIDRGYRKSLSIEWHNSILIFDEAHNLEGLCAEAASFDLPSTLLTACISEAKKCVDISVARREKSNDKSSNPDNFAVLRALLLKLEKRIAEVPIESKELGFTRPGPYIYELLADLNIKRETADMLSGIIDDAVALLEEDANNVESGGAQKMKAVCRLESMGDIIRLIFRTYDNAQAKNYRVHVQEVEGTALDVFKGKTSRTLSWWCFNPGIAMEEFSRLAVGSIILTSGTLSPLDSFAAELKLEFPVRLENPHVISENQLWAGVVPVGPSGYSFNSSYQNRDSLEYKEELGNAIVNFARIVPDGLLVFFPSYYLLERCIGCWKTTGHTNSMNCTSIWERICKFKLPVVEPRQSSLFPLSIEDYMAKLKDKSASGAVFFAVCRGKVSEGLDFADHAGRAVVITGMPFATRTDPKVRLKREYLDEQAHSQRLGQKALTGEDWYCQQASRAVNQAIGRVIRHRHDYGAIIFCDERFLNPNRQSQISLWMQPHIRCYTKFGDVVFRLTRFFRDERLSGPAKLELAQNEDQEHVNELQRARALHKLHSEKLPTSTNAQVSISVETSEQKQGKTFGDLARVVPANRSSLSSGKPVQNVIFKQSSSASCIEKSLLIPGRKHVQFRSNKSNDLAMSADNTGHLIAPCSLKKPKLIIEGPYQTENSEKFNELPFISKSIPMEKHSTLSQKNEKLEWSERGFKHNSQGGKHMLESEMTAQHLASGLIVQKNKGTESGSASCDEEEKKGSAFLIQVREKLTDAEYKEFVNFMKALKAKSMKIAQVLQSIASLFSHPDRRPLLHRFKDYIPAKYHSLYEQYVLANCSAAGI